MMITYPYVVFPFKYTDKSNESWVYKKGYLFYDTAARQLYKMPEPYGRNDEVDQTEFPIRVLSKATSIGPPVDIQSPYDFAHNKKVREIIKEKYPGWIRLSGTWACGLLVGYDEERVLYHCPDYLYDKYQLNVLFHKECHINPHRTPSAIDWSRRFGHRDISRTLYDTELGQRWVDVFSGINVTKYMQPLEYKNGRKTLVPQMWRHKKEFIFRSIKLITDKAMKPGVFSITETKLSTPGHSKPGKLTRCIWYSGHQRVSTWHTPVELTTDKEDVRCYLNGVEQKTLRQLWDTINTILAHIQL